MPDVPTIAESGVLALDLYRQLLFDRLLHHAHLVQIAGESYRLKD